MNKNFVKIIFGLLITLQLSIIKCADREAKKPTEEKASIELATSLQQDLWAHLDEEPSRFTEAAQDDKENKESKEDQELVTVDPLKAKRDLAASQCPETLKFLVKLLSKKGLPADIVRNSFFDFLITPYACKPNLFSLNHNHQVTKLIQLKNGLLVSAANDGKIKVWNLNKKDADKCIYTFRSFNDYTYTIIELQNGDVITGGNWGAIEHFKVKENGTLEFIGYLNKGEFETPDGNPIKNLIQLKNGLLVSLTPRIIKVWDLTKSSNKCITTINLLPTEGSFTSICSINDADFAVGSVDKIRIFNKDINNIYKLTLTLPNTPNRHNVNYIIQLKNGLVAAAIENEIKIWDLNKAECILTLAQFYTINKLVELNNGLLISYDSNGVIHVWDIRKLKNKCIASVKGHDFTSDYTKVNYSSIKILNNDLVVSFSNDDTLKIWKITEKGIKLLKTLNNLSQLRLLEKLSTYNPNFYSNFAQLCDGRFAAQTTYGPIITIDPVVDIKSKSDKIEQAKTKLIQIYLWAKQNPKKIASLIVALGLAYKFRDKIKKLFIS